MSEPKRYEVTESFGMGDMIESSYGNWVKWEAYARLKAEVERLIKERDKALTDFWYIHEGYFRLQAEVNRLTAFTTRTIIPNKELQAQVDRLTKAGDAVYQVLAFRRSDPELTSMVGEQWHKAKEGKDQP